MRRNRTLLVAGIALAIAVIGFLLFHAPAPAPPPPPPRVKPELPPPPVLPMRPLVAAPDGRLVVAPLPDGGAGAASRGAVVLRGRWGSAPGEFGRRRDPESNPEVPMAIAAGAPGELALLDQVNRRVERYQGGRLTATVSVGGDTPQDVALAAGGRTVLLDRLADKDVQIYDGTGRLENSVNLVGKGLPEGGGTTGVFTDDTGVYVEREHGTLVRVADARGASDPDRAELWGRPSRDGRLLLRAAIADRASGVIEVQAVDRGSGQPAWSTRVSSGAPVLHLLELATDRAGMVYLAAASGRESDAPPYPIVDEKITLFRLSGSGAARGALELPPLPSADEAFRPISVGEDGAAYVMVPGPEGLEVVRYTFP